MNITWSDAGKGPVDLTLANVQHLAIEAGFVFDVDEAQPLNKRANLQSKLLCEIQYTYSHHISNHSLIFWSPYSHPHPYLLTFLSCRAV